MIYSDDADKASEMDGLMVKYSDMRFYLRQVWTQRLSGFPPTMIKAITSNY